MIRSTVVCTFLVAAVCLARADDKDPVKDKLFAAKVAYDKEMQELRKLAGDWFDKREEAARKDGNKKLVEQITAERKVFDEDGFLPKTAPPAVQQISVTAWKTLDAAYSQAVKEYIKAKKDDEASAVEKEWNAFLLTARGAVDLLALVDTKAHTISGEWKKDEKGLVSAPGSDIAILQLAYEPGEEYDFELNFRRTRGNNHVSFGLVAGGRQVTVYLDGWPQRGHEAGFELVDKKALTTFKGPLLKNDKTAAVVCSVRAGKVEVKMDGKTVASFQGDFARLSLHETHRIPNTKALFLRCWSGDAFVFDRIVVTPVKGKGTILK